ncbi:acyl carrier protein [Roseospira goensis]|uniref:Acyl carrier protein n=1 Tax=Roseospira goensis TaxID=391922 RepID=A0A7W6WJL0_9PROT|nr:acyl carrier protein [Roseospira goensis]MBB4284612.1 acyl carrier protein [Roseospira goensis]
MPTLRSVMSQVLRLPVDAIDDDASMRTLPQWDSLKHMDLIVSLEEAYGLTLDGDEIAAMTSYGAIAAVLRRKGVTP